MKVFIAGLMARELGGGRLAQILAALATLVAPVFLGTDHVLTMNPFDQLLWMLATFILIRLLKTENPKLWIWFGFVVGIGLMNKLSMVFFGFALIVALVLTPNRKYFAAKWLWLGGLIALVIFSPYLIWQIKHGWQTLEFYGRYAAGKTYPVSPLEFLGQQILTIHPFTLPLWLAGLFFYLFSETGKPYRLLGWIYVVLFVVFMLQRAKFYFLSPAYPMLFAAGALVFEQFTQRRTWIWARPVYIALLIGGGILLAPVAIPVLPVETFIKYAGVTGIGEVKTERHTQGRLPQFYADMFGWEEMVATVAKVYHSLPPEDQARCCISAGNYGEAGAVDFFGKKYGLPKAVCGHNNYWLWGPRDCTGEVIIELGGTEAGLKNVFYEVELAAVFTCDYCMPYENNLPIYLCRKLKIPVAQAWSENKEYN
ncbi:MAG: glycosyltransferase family 39 protein [candidate division KSB1 bacterium]|nr:glycosyltransferase family 39 protein [candidate division KSB1 bacterium]MDZ7313983.1 glycosyltransferase family 39 protein [candidate division KSB1 bacterium]